MKQILRCSERRFIYPVVVCVTILLSGWMTGCSKQAEYTRGVGIYPGDPQQDFSPTLKSDPSYRNLALNRAAYQSSSYDYNLTAQLITDGIIDHKLPKRFSVSTSSDGVLPKYEREHLVDRNGASRVQFNGKSGWVQIELINAVPVNVDSINIIGSVEATKSPANWSFVAEGSDDGDTWTRLGSQSGNGAPGQEFRSFFRRPGPNSFRQFNQVFHLSDPASFKIYRVRFSSDNAVNWSVSDMGLFVDGAPYEVGGPFDFTSSWMSAGNQQEWVYVDLGSECSIDRIVLHWVRRAVSGSIQTSSDAREWSDLAPIPAGTDTTDDIKLNESATARYVRLLMTKAVSPKGYLLSEMQVFGSDGPVVVPHPAPAPDKNGRLDLAGGAWKVQRINFVKDKGDALSQNGYKDKSWIVATVPGTVLMSYYNAGCIPDPNFGDNQLALSETFFYSDFWYRTEFKAPGSGKGKRQYLNFDGINWKAHVWLNGEKLGEIDGAFTRARFDVTDKLKPGKTNALAVRIIKNATPGMVKEQTALSPDINGGQLGADNPTFHASVGWDWIPTIRGRNIGIWNDVYISGSGPITIQDPFVNTDLPLPDTSYADINLQVDLVNHTDQEVSGELAGTFGNVAFSQPVTLAASETQTVSLSPATHPELKIDNPALWWPQGYGPQNLYDVTLKFNVNGKISDQQSFKTGIREMNYTEADIPTPKGNDFNRMYLFMGGKALKIWINGRRFIGRGGNWGFSESNLCYRGREYDIAVRYHKDMNFTMIRNWVGQTGDDEFFEACDKYGVMVWQDFWLANPVDGPNPDDPDMFLANARDFVKKLRNHPSIGLYCGRNEGNPPDVIDNGLREIIATEHKGLHYISNSAFGVVSGGGFYRAMPIKTYFEQRATPKFHSEMGMPNIVNFESLKLMMPDSAYWPQGRMWGLHDFCLQGAQGGASFNGIIDESFGGADNLQDWLTLAQWVNYEGYRGMFEAQSKYRMGLLLWMSHPAWPSFVWQTYDYYFEPTAAYFACKKASEPLHIQWNALSDSIEVVNYNGRDHTGLTAQVELINLDGKVKWDKSVKLDSKEDSTVPCMAPDYPKSLSDTYFMRLRLKQGDEILSENFYWRGTEQGNFTALRNIPKVEPEVETHAAKQGDTWMITTKLKNKSKTPLLMARLKVVGEQSGERILPVMYSDNYVSLMPGEKRTLTMELQQADTRGEKPTVVVEGLNVK